MTLDTLVTQPLLDQADTSLDFVALKENLRPIHVERINQAFLLCYSDFSFFVNKHGWRANQDWKIIWEGNPQSFAIHQPYVLAFEPNFIEIRVMETGAVAYIQREKNVRMLHSSTREVSFVVVPPCYGMGSCIAAGRSWVRTWSTRQEANVYSFRSFTPMKMNLARTWLPAWISGHLPTTCLGVPGRLSQRRAGRGGTNSLVFLPDLFWIKTLVGECGSDLGCASAKCARFMSV